MPNGGTMISGSGGVRLEYSGRDFYNFDDHSYRWVAVKRFEIVAEGAQDRAILGALLTHARYRDHYLSSDSHEIDCGPLHGPYRLEAITVDAFEPVSEETARGVVTGFTGRFGDPPQLLLDRLNSGVFPLISEANARFRLRPLADEAMQHRRSSAYQLPAASSTK